MPWPKSTDKPLDATTLRSLIDYDPITGNFVWIKAVNSTVPSGRSCGSFNKRGYLYISLNNRQYLGHRLAWFYVHGEWPTDCIDHINGNPRDNSIANLRPATRLENNRNQAGRKGRLKGTCYLPNLRKWEAKINLQGKTKYLGIFESEEAAHAAYAAAAKEHFGEFARLA